MARLKALFTGKKEIDPAILEQMEEIMISSDVGVKTTQSILERLREKLQKNELADSDAVWAALRAEATRILDIGQAEARSGRDSKQKPMVVLMVGVNGVGKTTTIGKLATKWNAEGKKVVLAAGDTFRAAAVEQLTVWAERIDVPIVAQQTGADPAAVVFDALQSAQARGIDVLIADTAGRLHTQSHLMEELKKVRRVLQRLDPAAPHEVLLVLDASLGQNAIRQAEQFNEAIGVTGLAVTKLDGTAKGGVVIAIARKFGLPLRFVGVGEQADDFGPFQADAFVDGLLKPGSAA
jgi:fused signal recognition particle receptor